MLRLVKTTKVQLIAGENLTVSQNERDFTYSLNKDLVKMNSATFEATGGKQLLLQAIASLKLTALRPNASTAAGNTVDGNVHSNNCSWPIKDGARSNTSFR